MNNLVKVFEIEGGGSAIPWLSKPVSLSLGYGFIAIGIILIILLLMIKPERFKIKLIMPFFMIIWGIIWQSFSSSDLSMYQHADKLYESYVNKQYDIIEGPVEVLRVQPEEGHAPGDLIRVGNKQFEINYFVLTPAYRQTISHGGVLKNGTYAKIYYKGRFILRIDIDTSYENK